MFHISFEVKHEVQLFNQNGAKIEQQYFEKVVKRFGHSASFCIHLYAKPQQSDMPVITPKVCFVYEKLRLFYYSKIVLHFDVLGSGIVFKATALW